MIERSWINLLFCAIVPGSCLLKLFSLITGYQSALSLVHNDSLNILFLTTNLCGVMMPFEKIAFMTIATSVLAKPGIKHRKNKFKFQGFLLVIGWQFSNTGWIFKIHVDTFQNIQIKSDRSLIFLFHTGKDSH